MGFSRADRLLPCPIALSACAIFVKVPHQGSEGTRLEAASRPWQEEPSTTTGGVIEVCGAWGPSWHALICLHLEKVLFW